MTYEWTKEERAVLWNQLICCDQPSEQSIQYFRAIATSVEGKAHQLMRLGLACAQFKEKTNQNGKDDLRMFLVYLLSNEGTSVKHPELNQMPLPTRDNLNLLTIRGRKLSWQQIFEIFGRESNPSRIRQQVMQQYESLGEGVR